MTRKLGTIEYINWVNEHVKSQLSFVQIGTNFSSKELVAYEAGMREGFGKARAMLLVQNCIEMAPSSKKETIYSA